MQTPIRFRVVFFEFQSWNQTKIDRLHMQNRGSARPLGGKLSVFLKSIG